MAGLSTDNGISISAYTAFTASHTLDAGAATLIAVARGRSVINVPVSGLVKIGVCLGVVFSTVVPELAQAVTKTRSANRFMRASARGRDAFLQKGAKSEDAARTRL